eukprot:403354842
MSQESQDQKIVQRKSFTVQQFLDQDEQTPSSDQDESMSDNDSDQDIKELDLMMIGIAINSDEISDQNSNQQDQSDGGQVHDQSNSSFQDNQSISSNKHQNQTNSTKQIQQQNDNNDYETSAFDDGEQPNGGYIVSYERENLQERSSQVQQQQQQQPIKSTSNQFPTFHPKKMNQKLKSEIHQKSLQSKISSQQHQVFSNSKNKNSQSSSWHDSNVFIGQQNPSNSQNLQSSSYQDQNFGNLDEVSNQNIKIVQKAATSPLSKTAQYQQNLSNSVRKRHFQLLNEHQKFKVDPLKYLENDINLEKISEQVEDSSIRSSDSGSSVEPRMSSHTITEYSSCDSNNPGGQMIQSNQQFRHNESEMRGQNNDNQMNESANRGFQSDFVNNSGQNDNMHRNVFNYDLQRKRRDNSFEDDDKMDIDG